MGSISFPGRIRAVPEDPLCRPAFPGYYGTCPRCGGVEQLSQATRACSKEPGVDQPSRATRVRVRVPAGSTSCPWRLQPWSKGLRGRPEVPGLLGLVFERSWGRPSVPGYSGPCLRARSVDQVTRATPFGFECPRGRPAVPGVSAWVTRIRMVDQLSRATRARVRGLVVSTSSPR